MSDEKRHLGFVDPTATIGKDCHIWHYAVVLRDVKLGDNVSIGSHAEIGRGTTIGSGSRIGKGVFLPPNSVVGMNVFIGPGTVFCDDKYPRVGNVEYHAQPPTIEAMASIGAGVVVLPGVRIGFGALIGAGSTVTKDVPAKTVFRGEPAREVGLVDNLGLCTLLYQH